MRDLLNITCNPDVIACDLHPDYMTSHLGVMISQGLNVELVQSQNYHTFMSVTAEQGMGPDEALLRLVWMV